MYDHDQSSFSLVSMADIDTVYTPTDQDTDEFELLDDFGHEGLRRDVGSSGSTSVSPSVYAHEFEHGRRYHSYRSGRYPLPNDVAEQQREDTKHAFMLELTVGGAFVCFKHGHSGKGC